MRGCRDYIRRSGQIVYVVNNLLFLRFLKGNAQSGIQESTMNKRPAVYILANKKNGTLYVGVTSDLIKRVWEHKNNLVYGFTKRYSVHKLMWYELHETMISAITREKTLKNWKRAWKMELIEENNPLGGIYTKLHLPWIPDQVRKDGRGSCDDFS